jgi:hypothetical protein
LRTRLGEPIEDALIKFCDTPKTRGELAEFLGTDKELAMEQYVRPLIEKGKIFYTIPDSPHTPQQRFVNGNGKEYVITRESLIQFCKEPRSIDATSRFLHMNQMSARTMYLYPLIESGRLKRTMPRNGKQRYLDSDIELSAEQLFKIDKMRPPY